MATEPADLISLGVAAMCGVPTTNFNDKHWGAAVIAAGLLARDPGMPPMARSAMIAQAERLSKAKSEWFPPPVEAGTGDLSDVVVALTNTAGSLNLLGNDTTFATLALRALSDQPELATSANVEALVNMVEFAATRGPGGPFVGWDDPEGVIVDEDDEIPPVVTVEELAQSAVTVFTGVGTVYDGFDRGVVQHLLTHAHALVELHRQGHTDAMRSGIEAHRIYRKLMTRRPSDGVNPLPLEAETPGFYSEEYWQQDLRGQGDWLFGHVFKVGFAWTALEHLVPHQLRTQALPMLATSMVIT
jgi:hypothetical protein